MVQGARRVGKSYIVEEFARKEYKSYILIDFNRASEEIRELFLNDLDDLDTFFLKLKAAYNVSLKFSKRYTLASIRKFMAKYDEQLHTAYVLHPGDMKEENGIVYLPLYMTPFL